MSIFDRLRGKQIFISYRRSDSAEVTGRIHNALAAELGKKSVFQDVSDIPLGKDFQKVIAEAITQCAVQLVVIGPHWLDAVNEYGQRRLLDPNDIVRLEIELALKHGLRIIPLLVDGAAMPKQYSLPVSMQALSNFNGQAIRGGTNFEEDMRRVAQAIKHPAPQSAGADVEPLVPQLRTPLIYTRHSGEVISTSWSPDGGRIASAGKGEYVHIWEAREGTPTLLTIWLGDGKQKHLDIVAWSPDGARIATLNKKANNVRIWDAGTGEIQQVFKVLDRRPLLYVASPVLCWSPDGKLLAAELTDSIKVWNIETGRVVTEYRGHTEIPPGDGYIESLCWSPDGKTVSSTSAGRIHIWDPASGRRLRLLGNPSNKQAILNGDLQPEYFWRHACSSDGRIAVVWSPESKNPGALHFTDLAILDAHDGTVQATYDTAGDSIIWLGWSPDDTRLATLSGGNLSHDGHLVYVIDARTGDQIYTFQGHRGRVLAAAWSPEGGRIASGGMDKTVQVWPAPPAPRH